MTLTKAGDQHALQHVGLKITQYDDGSFKIPNPTLIQTVLEEYGLTKYSPIVPYAISADLRTTETKEERKNDRRRDFNRQSRKSERRGNVKICV